MRARARAHARKRRERARARASERATGWEREDGQTGYVTERDGGGRAAASPLR